MTATHFGGCMRLYPANHATPGPRWHVDEDHHIKGIDPNVPPFIDPDSGFIHFYMLEKNPIIDAGAKSDETLTGRGIHGGISNGTFLIRIGVHKEGIPGHLDLRRADHWALVAGNYCNFWVGIDQDVPTGVVAVARRALAGMGRAARRVTSRRSTGTAA